MIRMAALLKRESLFFRNQETAIKRRISTEKRLQAPVIVVVARLPASELPDAAAVGDYRWRDDQMVYGIR